MCDTNELLSGDLFECMAKSIVNYFTGDNGMDFGFTDIIDFIYGLKPPQATDGTLVLIQEPNNYLWETIYNATWISGDGMEMLALGLFMLFFGTMLSGLAGTITGNSELFTPDMPGGRITGFIAVLFSYPIGVTLVAMAYLLTVGIAPSASVFQDWKPVTTFLDNPLAVPQNVLYILLLFFYFRVLQILYLMQWILLAGGLFILPVLFGTAYSGLPVFSRWARKLLRALVPLALVPVPVGITTRGLQLWHEFSSEAESNLLVSMAAESLDILLVIAWGLMTVYLTWKVLAQAAPTLTDAIGGAAKWGVKKSTGLLRTGVRTAVGVASAGVVWQAGGSGYAISHAYRGNYAQSAIYTTNADVDWKYKGNGPQSAQGSGEPDTTRSPDENRRQMAE